MHESFRTAIGACVFLIILVSAMSCDHAIGRDFDDDEDFTVTERDEGGGLWRSTTLVPHRSLQSSSERTYGYSQLDYTTGEYKMGTVRCRRSGNEYDCKTTDY